MEQKFNYIDEKFADLQLLRYRLPDFDKLSLRQKKYIYYLSKAALSGRDITTDQFGAYNIRIRKLFEAIYTGYDGNRDCSEFQNVVVYLKRMWFSNGIYHHYGCEKFVPDFSSDYLRMVIDHTDKSLIPLKDNETIDCFCDEIFPVIFDPSVLPKRVNKADKQDLVTTSACNYYENLTQEEVEKFYNDMKDGADESMPSYGLNSKLVKRDGSIVECKWTETGMYGPAISHIIYWLEKARDEAENEQQKKIISILTEYYRTGDLRTFDSFSIEWLKETEGRVDFINGFIEVYGDPLGLKASWEGFVSYKDIEATRRAQTISDNAQWFEDNSPIDPRFKKKEVKGVIANVVCAAMLGGDEYPSSAIGINLPNADWIRARYGSKSVTIGNLTEAYDQAAMGNGFNEEFVLDASMLELIKKYGNICDDLHTDLHECLGHGSGQLLPGVFPDALKAYGNTIEEARADLFGLYYIAGRKLCDLGLLDSPYAYKAHYYTYMMNGMLTQLTRIKPGHRIEEAHMRNRALIARWVYEHSGGVVRLVKKEGKTYIDITDYQALRSLFAELLAEIQRIKSEGDYDAAKAIVESYAINVDETLHSEILSRYATLNISPYKGFINPRMQPVYDEKGDITDILLDFTESYAHQMMRYSSEYGFL
ncbi:dipeptidyl-peptidase 3 family protein [Leyella lascolaii]|uniref:Dihydrofolate reductase n=1 Tax=Leyella lascolaii TaxID=1776379 RepID=A0AAW7JRQ1_9BACT|nr:dihydrofolate reductase [Leyella lascolaii]MDN0023690.1 dihydrofolate reductase [Leyella lascolaii]MDN0026033.1 dihydrofolate reductase [Leyella lascolaii]